MTQENKRIKSAKKRLMIQIRVNEEEHAMFAQAANEENMTITDVTKYRTIHVEPRRKVSDRARKALVKILGGLGMTASNVKQISRVADDKNQYSAELKDLIKQASHDIDGLYEEILGLVEGRNSFLLSDEEMLKDFDQKLSKIGHDCNQIAKEMNTDEKVFYKVSVSEDEIRCVMTNATTVTSGVFNQINYFYGGSRKASGERKTVGKLPLENGG